MQSNPSSFWHLDIGNVLTWAGVVFAYFGAKIWDARGIADNMKSIRDAQDRHEKMVKEWKEEHQKDDKSRDNTQKSIELAVRELKVIADYSERRLTLLETQAKPGALERIHDRIDDIAKTIRP